MRVRAGRVGAGRTVDFGRAQRGTADARSRARTLGRPCQRRPRDHLGGQHLAARTAGAARVDPAAEGGDAGGGPDRRARAPGRGPDGRRDQAAGGSAPAGGRAPPGCLRLQLPLRSRDPGGGLLGLAAARGASPAVAAPGVRAGGVRVRADRGRGVRVADRARGPLPERRGGRSPARRGWAIYLWRCALTNAPRRHAR